MHHRAMHIDDHLPIVESFRPSARPALHVTGQYSAALTGRGLPQGGGTRVAGDFVETVIEANTIRTSEAKSLTKRKNNS